METKPARIPHESMAPDESILETTCSLQWAFLEEEKDSCAVISQRMEFVYINTAARSLIPDQWFGKRCFEVIPVADVACAWQCPTIKAVDNCDQIVYCEETVCTGEGPNRHYGVLVIPLPRSTDDPAQALLLLREKEGIESQENFEAAMHRDGNALLARVLTHRN